MSVSSVRPSPSRMTAAWAIALAIAALYFAQDVLIPIALSVMLAFLLAPICHRLQRRGVPQTWAVIASVTVAFALIGGLGYAVGTQVYALGEMLQKERTQDEIVRKAATVRGLFGGGGFGQRMAELGEKIDRESAEPSGTPATTQAVKDSGVAGAAERIADEPLAAATGTEPPTVSTRPAAPPATTRPVGTADRPFYTVPLPAPPTPIELVSRYLGVILGPLGTAGLVIVFVIFVLLEREQLRDRLIRLVSGGNYTATTAAINDATGRISRYMLAQTIVNGSYGLTISLGLWVIGRTMGGGQGFPSFVLWGLLCAILRFIPYIGPWTASLFPVALSLAVYQGFGVFAAVVAMFVVIELFSNNVMEPWLYGSSTGLSTVAILVAAVFWTWLWGPIGLLLSTPLTVLIVVMGKFAPQLAFLEVLLSDRPALPPSVRLYQRLLADDVREARAIALEGARALGWSRAADEVVVPALTLMRRDRRNEHLDAAGEAAMLTKVGDLADALGREEEYGRAAEAAKAAADAADATPAAPPARVLAFPTHHRSEEAALHLLPLGTDAGRLSVEVGSTKLLAGDVVARVEAERPVAVVLGVVPPGGLAQARYLCRRIKRRVPDVAIVVCYFGRPRNFDRLLRRLRTAGAAYVTTSVVQTQTQLMAIVDNGGRAAPIAGGGDGPKFVDGPAT